MSPLIFGSVMNEYPYYSPTRLRAALEAHGAAPRKRLGQNFLIDPNHIRLIRDAVLAAAGPDTDEPPLFEIGPGPGALTYAMLAGGRRVIAVEIDPVLGALLEELLADSPNFQLIRGDAREVLSGSGKDLSPRPRFIYGNLPYYITTELLLGTLAWPELTGAVFLVQHEFAVRLAGGAESSLAVYAGNICRIQTVHTVPAAAFYPAPDVKSTVIQLTPHPTGPHCDPARLERLLRATYQGKRKTLRNNWKGNAAREGLDANALFEVAEQVELDVSLRPEQVAPETYHAIVRGLGDEPQGS